MKKNDTKLNSLDKYKFANKVCKYNMVGNQKPDVYSASIQCYCDKKNILS